MGAFLVHCQTRNMRQIKTSLQTTEFPLYLFAILAVDITGPYLATLNGNKYIIALKSPWHT